MLVEFLKSKIHKATITQRNINYVGSITIDAYLMEKAGILPYEKVSVANFQNGNRFETYVIKGRHHSGIIGLNGPAALLGEIGQVVTILAYGILSADEAKSHKPKVIILNPANKIQKA